MTEVDAAMVGGWKRRKPILETVAVMLVVTLIRVLTIILSGIELTMCNFRGSNYSRGPTYHWVI